MYTINHKFGFKPMTSTTLTVRLPEALKDKLGELATHTKRTRSYLAAEAIENYVENELAIVRGVECGLDDMRAGRVVAHEEVMTEIGDIISEAKRKQE
jgi:predicted transcriptional regulator